MDEFDEFHDEIRDISLRFLAGAGAFFGLIRLIFVVLLITGAAYGLGHYCGNNGHCLTFYIWLALGILTLILSIVQIAGCIGAARARGERKTKRLMILAIAVISWSFLQLIILLIIADGWGNWQAICAIGYAIWDIIYYSCSGVTLILFGVILQRNPHGRRVEVEAPDP